NVIMEAMNWIPSRNLIFSIGLLCILLPKQICGKIVEGTLTTKEDWQFLSRFCFLSEKGRLEFVFEYPKSYESIDMLLYFDDEDQWPAVYKTSKTCQQKLAVLKPENNQVINLSLRYAWSGCAIENKTWAATGVKQEQYVCSGGRSFRSVRERWWFIAVSNCESTKGLTIKYKLTMTNDDSNIFFRQFSADEFYIYELDIAFLVITIIMLGLTLWAAVILRGRQLFHTTYKMYMVSLATQCMHLLIMCIAYGKFANDGLDNYGIKVVARIFDSFSLLTFLLMLILLGKGYTITRGRLSSSGSIKIAVFMTLYSITFIVLFVYEAYFFDAGQVLYLYESPPGYGLIAMRLLGWLWFCYAIFFTLKHYPEKASFYYPFFIFYTLWFWAGPIVILIAMHVMNLWVREKVVNGIENMVVFIGQIFFLILTRPSAANTNFPYHVRTSQIGVMTAVPQQNGVPLGTNMDSFSARPYAPSSDMNGGPRGPNFSNLFVVSNQRSEKTNNNEAKSSGDSGIDEPSSAAPRKNPNMFVTSSATKHSRPAPSGGQYDNKAFSRSDLDLTAQQGYKQQRGSPLLSQETDNSDMFTAKQSRFKHQVNTEVSRSDSSDNGPTDLFTTSHERTKKRPTAPIDNTPDDSPAPVDSASSTPPLLGKNRKQDRGRSARHERNHDDLTKNEALPLNSEPVPSTPPLPRKDSNSSDLPELKPERSERSERRRKKKRDRERANAGGMDSAPLSQDSDIFTTSKERSTKGVSNDSFLNDSFSKPRLPPPNALPPLKGSYSLEPPTFS
ncbi:unnamed protein product, partial [Owenia fusiformis]